MNLFDVSRQLEIRIEDYVKSSNCVNKQPWVLDRLSKNWV